MIGLAIFLFCMIAALAADNLANRNVLSLPFKIMAVIGMIIVGMFSAKIVNVFGLISNAGVVIYSFVFFCQAVIYERAERNSTLNNVYAVSLYTAFAFVLVQLLALYEPEQMSKLSLLVNEMTSSQAQTFFASLASFFMAMIVFISVAEWLKDASLWTRYVAASACAQLIDTLLFFTALFAIVRESVNLDSPTELILSGLLIKAVFIILSAPVFVYMHKRYVKLYAN